ncbi:LytR/AlgR family response regulator transcription factor [Larkinella soli]|uniref:LytR/AlgR family response regulator transcription factor n=1 Tax=Larkinella soli TaxID=1770527 RepID=UPI000FFC35F0|nr:response regulator [Larkinella soli]
MEEEQIQILVVEDEAVLAMYLCDILEEEGYNVVGTVNNGRKALDLFKKLRVDLVICDIQLKGDWDGIETVGQLQAVRHVPVIYTTALSGKEVLDRAKLTRPAAYLTKPVAISNLRIAIELALYNFSHKLEARPHDDAHELHSLLEKDAPSRETILRIDNLIFIKHNYQFVKIPLEDIMFLEADGAYTTITTHDRKFAIRLTLSTLLDRLSETQLVRVHRSFAVHIKKVEGFSDREITVGKHIVPLGRQYKPAFIQQFQIW